MSNLKVLVKAHNNALRNLHLLMKEQYTFPQNVVYRPSIAGTPLPWLPNNYVKRLHNARKKYHLVHRALHNAIGTPNITPNNKFIYRTAGSHRHTSNWNKENNTNRPRINRVRRASNAVRGNAATVLQKIWRGLQNRRRR